MRLRMGRMLVALLGVLGVAALAPSLALADATIAGQATDAVTGNGISKVIVNLWNASTGELIGQATTGNDGTYNLGAWPNGSYDVEFADSASRYGTLWYTGQSNASLANPVTVSGSAPLTVNQALQPDQVTGQVTDQVTHQPIAGVEVELLNASGSHVAQATTDGGGNYSFSAIPAGTYEVAFNPHGASSQWSSAYYGGVSPTGFSVVAGQTTSAINGQLLSGGAVSGTVTGSGQVLRGAQVLFTNVDTGGGYYVSTGSDGTYQLDGLPTGHYQVLFRPANGQNYVYQYYPDKSNAGAAQAVSVTTGQTTSHIDASLATGATISGTVKDTGGNRLAGAQVYVRYYGGGYPNNVRPNSATTDANGAWSVVGLPTGTYEVQFYPPNGSNYASQYYNEVNGTGAPTPITLTAGSTTSSIDAALSPGGQISGTVTDGTLHAPAKGVSVAAYDNAGDQFASTQTDAAGHYTLTALSPSASYRVEFYPPQGSSLAAGFYSQAGTLEAATPVGVTMGQTTPNIDETLGAGSSISGVVTAAATGYPIGGVQIGLTDDAGQQVFGNSLSVYTDADGSYEITNLPPGTYKVKFSSEGALGSQYYPGASTLSAASSVTVGAGQTVTGIDGALTPGGTLAGRVTDASTGQALADVDVAVVDTRGAFVTFGFTDPNGRYEIPGIAPGTYYVQFFPTGSGIGATDQPQFYGGTSGLAGATPVTISAGETTSGIDGALAPPAATTPGVSSQGGGTPTTPTTPTTPPTTTTTTPTVMTTPPLGQVAQVIPGAPTLFAGFVSGLAKGKPVVRFRLTAGSNGAPKLRSLKVKLPAGLSFVAAQLRKGVKVTGGGKVIEKLTQGQLVVTLASPASAVTVSIGSPALKVSAQLAAKAGKKKAGTLRVTVTVISVNHAARRLSFAVKNPS